MFIAYPDVARAFPVFAKELYSWIPQRYRFHTKALSPRKFSQALRMEEKTRFVGDKDREYLRDLISVYEDQLRNAPDDESFKVNNIITPLADLYKENDQFAKELQLRAEILEYWKQREDPQQCANAQNNLGTAYSDLPTGDRPENLKKAIAAYHEALTVYTRDAFPVQYATTQNNLSDVTLALKSIKPNDRLSDN